jgi:hypothetical protein
VVYKTYAARTGFRARFAERTGSLRRDVGLSLELCHIGGILGDVEALVLRADPPWMNMVHDGIKLHLQHFYKLACIYLSIWFYMQFLFYAVTGTGSYLLL